MKEGPMPPAPEVDWRDRLPLLTSKFKIAIDEFLSLPPTITYAGSLSALAYLIHTNESKIIS